MSIRNLKKTLAKADAIDINEGRIAWFRHNEMMRSLASHYDYPLESVVAAFAALSPNNDYIKNLRSTATVLYWHKRAADRSRIKGTSYNACTQRALRFLDGERFLDVTKGEKTRAFYLNILNPLDAEPVTIDGHMIGCWYGQRFRMKQVASGRLPDGTRWRYSEIATGFRELARREGILPNQLQAILWFTWKRLNNVLAETNYKMFGDDDTWGLIHQADEIKIYPLRSPETLPPPALQLQLPL